MDDLPAACAALEKAGWRRRLTGDNIESYLAEEGYACQFFRQESAGRSVLVELHFRLWGMVAEGLDAELLQESHDRSEAFAGFRSLAPAYAYLIAALHGWTRTRPRKLVDFRDLDAILCRESAAGERVELAARVVELARRWSLELPTCLGAEVAAQLWPESGHEQIVAALEVDLGRWEGRPLVRLRQGGIDQVALSGVVLGRLLAGRASRAGWKSVWRRVWAHPGVV